VVSESIASTRKDIVNNENGRWFLGDEWDMLDTINDDTSAGRKTGWRDSDAGENPSPLVNALTARTSNPTTVPNNWPTARLSVLSPHANHAPLITATSMLTRLQLFSCQRRLEMQVVRFVDRLS
jgi:hypothetical protein